MQNIGAWSKVANVLYLDSPSGVGLSYSSEAQDYVTNDTATASDSNVFLRKFFRLYPDFASHDFYISGMPPINPSSTQAIRICSLSASQGSVPHVGNQEV